MAGMYLWCSLEEVDPGQTRVKPGSDPGETRYKAAGIRGDIVVGCAGTDR